MAMPAARILLWLSVLLGVLPACGVKHASDPMPIPRERSQPQATQPKENQQPSVSFVGIWRLEPGEDLIEAARIAKREVPSMELEAYADGTFDLVGRVGKSEFEVSGEWYVSGLELTLRAKEVSGDAPILKSETEPRGGTISPDGRSFVDAGGWVWKRVQH